MAQRPSISRTVDVDAPAERVWALVSDLPGMGALSPENTGGSWLGGATGPAVGVRFRGSNRHGWRRWSTAVRITACEPGHLLSFDVGSLGLAVSRWTYAVAPRPGGCTVTETWEDRRGRAMDVIGLLASGVADRQAYTAQSIEHTLAAVKQRAEPAGPTG
ncbi:MAG: SRPBCC family protein [Frankiaceae bacterium]|nr:SRPBCC family protein [Frankiaceae bacterium]